VNGPDFTIKPAAAQQLSIAIHELATNAVKYGALSNSAGTIDICWQIDPAAGAFTLQWVESGGPAVEEPTVDGFGTVVLTRMTGHSFGGEAKLEFPPSGLVWRLNGRLNELRADEHIGAMPRA
jgi:two-component sensor histidine kinase